jgi:HEAT repeat protein
MPQSSSMKKKWPALFLAFVFLALSQTHHSLSSEANQVLKDALNDGNPNIRKQAVIALSLTASREPFLSELETMLTDKDVQVRIATVASLVDLHNHGAARALRRALNDQVPEVSFAAAKALFELHDPAGTQALLSVLSGESKTASNFFTDQMRNTIRMMHTPKTLFMFALRQGIGFAPVPGLGEGVASMRALLSDPGVSGRAEAALMLGRRRDRDTLRALREALSDKDWSVRAAAIHSLALWNDPILKSDLASLLNDNNKAVRLRAAAAYLRLDSLPTRATPL